MVPKGVARKGRVLVAAALVMLLGGCSRPIDGTPVAAPGKPAWAPGRICSRPPAGNTCRWGSPGRREVMTAIGEAGNRLVATNPDLWAGVAAALCTFADPSAPVKDVVTGGVR